MIAAYRHEDRRRGRELMVKLIDTISTGVPNALVEITTLGRTLKKRAADVLAYFEEPYWYRTGGRERTTVDGEASRDS
jgi:transposase